MTDSYGTEPHDHDSGHDEVLTHGQDIVREAPSDYEFADDHGAAAAEEHADEHHILSGDPPPERRSPVLAIAAAVAGVVLLGGVAWWQFGGAVTSAGGSDPHSMIPVAAGSTDPGSVPTTTVAPKSSSMALSSPSSSVAMPSAPIPIATAVSPSVPVPLHPANPSAASIDPMGGGAVETANPPMPQPIANNDPSRVASPVSGGSGSSDQKITALNARIDDLQKSMSQTAEQLSQISTMVATSVANASASAAASSRDTQDRLDHIEQQMAQMKHPAPVLAAPIALPSDTADGMAPVVTSAPAPAHTKASHASHRHALPQPVIISGTSSSEPPTHTTHTHHAVVHELMRPAPSNGGWILRAASPGQAWVSTSATSPELKQLHIGDELTGIGRVTSIQAQNGAWVVQGTKGTVQ